MARGRKPKPRSEKKILGFPGHHKLRKAPKSEKVKAPSYLNSQAKRIFDRLAPRVIGMKVAHVDQLADYCRIMSRLINQERIIAKEGVMVSGYRGRKVKNPRLQIVREYRLAIQRWAGEFGLTPVGDMRLGAKADGDGDGDDVLD